MNKMKIKIFTLLSLLITFSIALSSCDSLWDDLTNFTVSFNGNTGTGTMEPQIFEADVPQALNENTFTKDGYTFAGWATSANASTAEYADKANFTAKEDTTLYAIWNKIPPAPVPSKFTITYVSEHGTLPETKTVDLGYKITADDLKTLSETGYRFVGWDKAVGDEITANTTITASWIKTWTITYASNKSELNDKLPASKTVDEGYKLTADDLSALTADGYNFKGWDKSAGLEIKADVTITATWKKLFTISYSLPTGYSKDPKTVEEGYKIVATDLPNIETDTQYCEWDKTVGTEITADTTITAAWEDIVYYNKSAISKYRTNVEKIIFTTDTYSGTGNTTFNCASGSNPEYFTGVLTDDSKVITIYGNGRRIYAPSDCKQSFANLKTLTSIEFNNFFTSKVTDMSAMFSACNALTSLDLSSFDTSSVENMMGMFTGCIVLTSLDLSSFDTSDVTNMQSMFQACNNLTTLNISSFNTSSVTTLQRMFYGCNSLTELDVSKFVSTNVTNMSSLFSGCSSLKTIDLSSWNTEKVTNMSYMFNECKELTTLKISSLNTSEVSDMSYMFNTCEKLESLDLSHFNTSKVTTMTNMFNQCINLKSINVSSFDTSLITNMSHMFNKCNKLTLIEISNFATSSVTNMENMFNECNSLTTLELSSFSSDKLINITNMFSGCSDLVTIFVSSNFDLSTFTKDIFFGCSKLVGGAGTKYSEAKTSDPDHYKTATYARIDTDATPGYFTLKQ